MAFPVKQVRTLEEQLRIIQEVGKTPSEKRTDIAKQLGLPPSTLNRITTKKKKIREHTWVSVDQELATCGVVWCAVCGRNVWCVGKWKLHEGGARWWWWWGWW
jgi:NADH:ubiquinone oxidoreductase subunit E